MFARFLQTSRFSSAFQTSALLKRGLSTELKSSLDAAIKKNKILIFIKGTKTEPKCGFSRAVVQILETNGVTEYSFVNVLENEETRAGIKEYTNWPTIPQVFVNGEFIGGCDILINMHQSGELEKLLKELK
jgi:monothiol glutaredoxin